MATWAVRKELKHPRGPLLLLRERKGDFGRAVGLSEGLRSTSGDEGATCVMEHVRRERRELAHHHVHRVPEVVWKQADPWLAICCARGGTRT